MEDKVKFVSRKLKLKKTNEFCYANLGNCTCFDF